MELTSRFTGFFISLVLTLSAYLIIVNPEYFEAKNAIIIILSLALAQSLAQLIFFIDIWNEKGPLWNLFIFLSTASIIFVIIFFSIWIMDHLNYNMRS